MKVYILIGHKELEEMSLDTESETFYIEDEIIAMYDSKIKATKAKQEAEENKDEHKSKFCLFDSFDIEEFEVL